MSQSDDRERTNSEPQETCELWGCGRAKAGPRWLIQRQGEKEQLVDVCDYHDQMLAKADGR